MDTNEYISSGILELYVLGQLSPEEAAQVEVQAAQYVEVQQEIHAISTALEKYARLNSIVPPMSVETKLFDQLPPKASAPHAASNAIPNNPWKIISLLLAAGVLTGVVLFFQFYNATSKEKALVDQKLNQCDSIQNVANREMAFLAQMSDQQNHIVSIVPTENYNSTLIYLHHNATTKKNFLQLNNLPAIGPDQAYQLWSLKAGQDPIPMDVFGADKKVIEIGYEEGTPTYAITIEPKGGSKVPTLTRLIGTMTI